VRTAGVLHCVQDDGVKQATAMQQHMQQTTAIDNRQQTTTTGNSRSLRDDNFYIFSTFGWRSR
jgi:hypothetical protein